MAGPKGAFRERIDMAVFGPLPDFVRLSVRLTADAQSPFHGHGSRSAAMLLARLSAEAAAESAADSATDSRADSAADSMTDTAADSATDSAVSPRRIEIWKRAYAVVGLPASTVPPPEALLAWARSPGGVPSQGVVEDVVNAFALEHAVPAAAYDLAAVEGDLWLRPSRGHEIFEAADGAATTPAINDLILVDSADRVMAMAWHGAQSALTRVRPGAEDLLIHADLLGLPIDAARAMADALAARLAGFVGGRSGIRILSRDNPMAAWPV